MNKLITIGCLGCKRAYLNIPLEEAVRRFEAKEGEKAFNIEGFEFEDEFYVYEAGPERD